ncbi:MAG TPA: hypothetical protein VJ103_01875 [Candidatus Paceibacterota bacterium]|nr:hypothetical protein [Candidatus Paceibacterota bacterium]
MRSISLAKVIKIGSLALLFAGIFVFSYIKTKDLIFGVRLLVNGITTNANYMEPVLQISGVAKRVKNLTINGEGIFIDPAGNFEDIRILLPGYNKLTIATRDRFGKEQSEIYEVTYLNPIPK